MKEQEIVDFLRNNRTKGVVFLFLPEDVRDWIQEHFDDPNLFYLDSMGKWQYFKDMDFDDYDNVVFALPDTFYPQKPKGGWVEIEINKGKFNFIPSDVNGLDGVIESWWNWQEFLTVSSKYNLGFTAFGGWQYKDCDAWFLTPQIAMQGHFYNLCTKDDEPKPAIPVKIRFWREVK